jgi:predicted N-acetyltransferase YhbS
MTDLPLSIRAEKPADAEAIERLHERAFGPGRFARTAFRLREGVGADPALSFVALVATLLVGSIKLTRVSLGRANATLLGPLTVDPAFEGRGIGSRLIEAALAAARNHRVDLVFLVGDLPYYGRFGFKPVPPNGPRLPGPVDPARFLVLELNEAVLGQTKGEIGSLSRQL